MAIQTSGAISFQTLQNEFGGSHPISMSEYYRGGPYVPTTVGGAAGAYTGYSGNTTTYYWAITGSNAEIKWAGAYKGSTTSATNATFSGYEYNKGSYTATVVNGKGIPDTLYYKVRRRTTSTSVTVNTGIPASGTISISQHYGGRNT
tara:strand:- start:63 stop:503 length:441 start_codon:yes stop_codon:yes gene_type:complete